MFKIKILPLSGSAVDYLSDDRPVFGVSLLEYEFYCRFSRWVGFKYSKSFLRPINFSVCNFPSEAAGEAQPLRFG